MSAHSSCSSVTEFAQDLSTRRTAVLASAGPTVPQIEIDRFFTYLFPHSSDGPITPEVFSTICEDVLASQYTNGRWQSFEEDPADTKKEDVVFGGLIKIAQAVESVVRTKFSLEPTVTLNNTPDKVPSSKWRSNTTRPDGYFILREPQCNEPHWMDIAFPAEYKRRDAVKDTNDDVEKTIWNMHHIMREDARRRFTFGFTVENRTVRLWFSGRADVLVSDPFDFVSKPELLLEFFTTVMYARTEDLGWDPTMSLVHDVNGKHQYDIQVTVPTSPKPVVYRTIRLISNVGACVLRGRGTRVWEVQQLDANGGATGAPRVLKDSWPDSDRLREGEVFKQVLKDVGPKEDVRKFFLTIAAEGDVSIRDGESVDQTLPEDRRQQLCARSDGRPPLRFDLTKEDRSERGAQKMNKFYRSLGAEIRGSQVSSYSASQRRAQAPVRYSPKTHHRIVFEEVCNSLHETADLTAILMCLRNVCQPLQMMHEAGWVHRDISAGNILFTIVNGVLQVKLSDLEYAKRYNQTDDLSTAHEVRTGTQEFMAVEVNEQTYLFGDSTAYAAGYLDAFGPVQANPLYFDPTAFPPQIPSASSTLTIGTVDKPALRHNPLHDLESIWWLLAFFVFNKDLKLVLRDPKITLPASLIETPQARFTRLIAQEKFADSIFLDGTKRLPVFIAPDMRIFVQDCLHPALKPLATLINGIRAQLVDAYRAAEKDLSKIDYASAKGVYKNIGLALLSAIPFSNAQLYSIHVPCSIAYALHMDSEATTASVSSKPTKRKPTADLKDDEAGHASNDEPDPDEQGRNVSDDALRPDRKRAKTAA